MSATRSPSLELIDNTDLPDVVTLLHSDVASEHNADDDNPEHTLEGSFTDNADAMTEVGNDPLPVPAVRFLSVDISSLWPRFVPFGANAHLDANVEVVQVRVHDSRIVKAIWVISLVIFFLASASRSVIWCISRT